MKQATLTALAFGILLLCAGNAKGQCYFFRLTDYQTLNQDEICPGVAIDWNQDIVACGVTAGIPDGGMYVMKRSFCGDSILDLAHNLSPGADQANVIKCTPDSAYLLIGGVFNPVSQYPHSYVTRLDANGQLEHLLTYDLGRNSVAVDFDLVGKKDIVVCGLYNMVIPYGQGYLMKIDSAGNMLWKRDYGDSISALRVHSMDKTTDGGFIIGGHQGHPRYDFFLLKTDSLGNQEWLRRYSSGPNHYSIYNGEVAATADGGYIIAAVVEESPIGDLISGIILKTDSIGDVEWQRVYPSSGGKNFSHIVEIQNGNFLLVGGQVETNINNGDRLLGTLTKITPQGDIIWERTYTYYDERSINSFEELQVSDNSDIVIVGYIVPLNVPVTTRNDLLLLKTDSCGYTVGDTTVAAFAVDSINGYQAWFGYTSTKACSSTCYFGDGDSSQTNNPTHIYPDTGSYSVTLITRAGNTADTVTQTVTITAPVGMNEKDNIVSRIYPNPTTNHLTIELSQYVLGHNITLYNLMGGQILQEPLAGAQTTFTINLLPGLYIYRITAPSGYQKTGKLLVE